MKKIFALSLICLIMVMSVGTAFATDNFNLQSSDYTAEVRENTRFEALKEFKDELHQINAIRIEMNNVKVQLIERHDEIIDLYIGARESQNIQALKEAKQVKQEIKGINQEIKDIHELIVENRKAFKDLVKENNFDEAKECIDNVISFRNDINQKITLKIELLDKIIDILS